MSLKYELSHLNEDGTQSGSVQQDEALLLYAMVKVLHPRTIVEFGFAGGYSAHNFLSAMPDDCRLFSFDPSDKALQASRAIEDHRFQFLHKPGEAVMYEDIGENLVDFVFIDASHDFDSNVAIFQKIKDWLALECLIIIHDTGLYNTDFMQGNIWDIPGSYLVGEKGYAHRPGERQFVNYLKTSCPEFDQIHFHSMNVGRMGLTALKKYQRLSVREQAVTDGE